MDYLVLITYDLRTIYSFIVYSRYLLVKSSHDLSGYDAGRSPSATKSGIPLVPLDPTHPLTLSSHRVEIPMPSYRLDKMVEERLSEFVDEDMDAEDQGVFEAKSQPDVIEIEDTPEPPARQGSFLELGDTQRPRDANDWQHSQEWVSECVEHLLPPPVDATPSATMALQRELRAMLKEQEKADSLRDLGWYMPPEFVGDNLFQWIVELHSFDEALPIAKDLKAKKLTSLVFEIRFPPSFPLSPPFFRILKPRFLPFIQGGGGHVTGGE
jgi:ubiquitin-conjugating enzyme E2 Q